ncbi:hypothetical protein QTP88_015063 [Uroleucon formosanum]
MKKGDTKMVQNYENKNNDLVTSEVDKFHYEISGDNDEYLYKDTTMDSDFIRDEFTRKNPIDNAQDGDWICKKKKKKKGDTKMVQNYENKNNDLVTSEVDKFHYEISGDNDEYLYKDTKMDSEFIGDEFTRKNPIDNALDGDWICKKKKKKKGDTKMVQNYENKNNDLVTSEVDKFHYEISGDNDEYLYKDTTMDSDFIRDEFTRKNPIDNAQDGDWICKKKKKKKGDTKMVQNYENKNNDLVTSEVDKFHYEISGDNDEYLYKDTTMDSDFIRDEFTRKNPIDNAQDGDWM